MGVLIDGIWTDGQLPEETGAIGEFKRKDLSFRDQITADGSSGFKAEPGRYHLYVAHGCPWAHRTLLYRALKKLDNAISVAYSVPGLRTQGWTFEDDPKYPDCIPDRVNGFRYLHEAYTASDPKYTGKVTVPTLWDKKTKRIVNNEFLRDHPDAQRRVRRHRRHGHGLLSEAAPRRDRPHERTDLQQRQQRRLSLRLRQDAAGLRSRLRRPVRDARRAGGAARTAALSGRAADHRGRLAAVPHPGAVRRRLFLACSSATRSGSPTTPTSTTTCTSSIRCRAWPGR